LTKKFVLLFLVVLLGTPLVYQVMPYEVLKLKTFDALVTEQEPSGNFTILNITEEDVDKEGGYPFPRKRLAEIQIQLLEAGAIGVGWVIAFPHPDRMGGDAEFAEALSYAPSVLPLFETNNNQYPKTTGTVIMGEDIGGYEAQGVLNNIPILSEVSNEGIAVAQADVDGLIRRLPLLMRTPDGWVSAYGTEVLKVLLDSSTYIIKTNENGIEEIIVQGLPPVPVDSLGRKWVSWVDTPQTTLQEMDVEGTFVFIGVTAGGVMPQLSTPIGLLEPHKIQAALSESILIQESPQIPDYAFGIEIIILLVSMIAVWVFINNLGIVLGIALASSVMIATAMYGVYTVQQGVLIDVTWALITQFITGATAFYLRFREQYKLRQQIKKQFQKYLSPEMIEELQKHPEKLKLGGDRKELSFLFADIVGFTPISEAYMKNDDPEGLVLLINRFLDGMSKIVLANGGTIDKFMGDCLMAWWGAPLDCPNHAEMALKSAMEIELLTEQMNKDIKEEGLDLPPVVIGTGLNTGQCIVGNMGSEERFDYSVVGDAVNLAARLEVQTRTYDTPILMSEFTKNQITCKFHFIDEINVKGKEIPVKIYAPLFDGDTVVRKLKKNL
jgi:adenylate cyclase